MHSDRDIQNEMKEKTKKAVESDDRVWSDISSADDFDDFDFYAYELLEKGKSRGSIRVFRQAESKIKEFAEAENIAKSPTEFGTTEARKFARWLKDNPDVVNRTAGNYLSFINRMARFFNQVDYYAGNPFQDVTETTDLGEPATSAFSSNRVSVDLDVLKELIVKSPRNIRFVLVVFLLKTGVRISEAVNLDLEDIHLDHSVSERLPEPRSEIKNEPDTIYIDNDVEHGEKGQNNAGNKREIGTKIPIDDELKKTLAWWIAVMPPTESDESPLFVYNNLPGRDAKLGERLSTHTGSRRVSEWAERNGLHNSELDSKDNVTAHWFRALFTTEMTRRISGEEIDGHSPRMFVKGLRGDVGEDVIDVYIQASENYVREAYYNNIIKIGI